VGRQDSKQTRSAGTLGDVLYNDPSKPRVPEADWVHLVRSVAGGDEVALHALYERAHRPVFTLAVRITGSRESAEELTLDVFHDVWRRASGYDPANGTVLGWIMNQARSRAIDRVRFESRKKRVDGGDGETILAIDVEDGAVLLAIKQNGEAVRKALGVLTAGEREVIEAAFFSEMTHAEVAQRLKQPLGTVKTRIRSGLQKLRLALRPGGES